MSSVPIFLSALTLFKTANVLSVSASILSISLAVWFVLFHEQLRFERNFLRNTCLYHVLSVCLIGC